MPTHRISSARRCDAGHHSIEPQCGLHQRRQLLRTTRHRELGQVVVVRGECGVTVTVAHLDAAPDGAPVLLEASLRGARRCGLVLGMDHAPPRGTRRVRRSPATRWRTGSCTGCPGRPSPPAHHAASEQQATQTTSPTWSAEVLLGASQRCDTARPTQRAGMAHDEVYPRCVPALGDGVRAADTWSHLWQWQVQWVPFVLLEWSPSRTSSG